MTGVPGFKDTPPPPAATGDLVCRTNTSGGDLREQSRNSGWGGGLLNDCPYAQNERQSDQPKPLHNSKKNVPVPFTTKHVTQRSSQLTAGASHFGGTDAGWAILVPPTQHARMCSAAVSTVATGGGGGGTDPTATHHPTIPQNRGAFRRVPTVGEESDWRHHPCLLRVRKRGDGST